MTCLTCHAAIVSAGSEKATLSARTSQIRSGFCVECHQADSPFTPAVHASATAKAHLIPGHDSRAEVIPGTLDSESRSCLACHDGSAGVDAGSHRMGAGGHYSDNDHPIGVPMRATSRTKNGDFALARNPDPRVRLFGGSIGCGSCHSVYSREPARLVMSNRGSRLCLGCHAQP
ncbi:MAG: hypothetical protein JNK58_12055 [Phycisphaerae bacterium]|nr:hypothetical protein [Phycisphaerae bacterium]